MSARAASARDPHGANVPFAIIDLIDDGETTPASRLAVTWVGEISIPRINRRI